MKSVFNVSFLYTLTKSRSNLISKEAVWLETDDMKEDAIRNNSGKKKSWLFCNPGVFFLAKI